MENSLIIVNPKDFGLEKTEAQKIEAVFTPMLERMVELEKEYNDIIVLPLDNEKTQKARELRLKYVKVRTGTEKIHETAKAYYLAGGRFVDAWKNAQKFSAIGKETELEKIEKHFELIEQEKKDKIMDERLSQLSKYVPDTSVYNIREMSDEVFQNLLVSSKAGFEAVKEAELKAEQARLEKERAEKAEQERIRLENAELKVKAEAREKELAKERAEQEKKLEIERAKAKKEAEAREKLEAEVKAKELKLQAEKLAKLEADKKAESAPDREKLIAYAVELGCLEVPKLQTKEAKETLAKALSLLGQAVTLLKSN